MNLYSTYTIKTEGFQQVSYGINHLLKTVPLDKKCRVIMEYDPDSINAEVKTFTYSEDDRQALGKDLQKSHCAAKLREACWNYLQHHRYPMRMLLLFLLTLLSFRLIRKKSQLQSFS